MAKDFEINWEEVVRADMNLVQTSPYGFLRRLREKVHIAEQADLKNTLSNVTVLIDREPFGQGVLSAVKSHGPITPVKPASKPADPAFARALKARPLRIGLRYLGD